MMFVILLLLSPNESVTYKSSMSTYPVPQPWKEFINGAVIATLLSTPFYWASLQFPSLIWCRERVCNNNANKTESAPKSHFLDSVPPFHPFAFCSDLSWIHLPSDMILLWLPVWHCASNLTLAVTGSVTVLSQRHEPSFERRRESGGFAHLLHYVLKRIGLQSLRMFDNAVRCHTFVNVNVLKRHISRVLTFSTVGKACVRTPERG